MKRAPFRTSSAIGSETRTRSGRFLAYEASEPLLLHSRSAPVETRTRARALRRRAAAIPRREHLAAPGGVEPPQSGFVVRTPDPPAGLWVAWGNRTPVDGSRIRRPGPLDERDIRTSSRCRSCPLRFRRAHAVRSGGIGGARENRAHPFRFCRPVRSPELRAMRCSRREWSVRAPRIELG